MSRKEKCKRDAGVQRSMGVMEQDKRRRTEKQSSRRTAQEKESVEKQENWRLGYNTCNYSVK